MSALKGDFIGFTFNGIHSSELGLIRVSGGSRYDENLLPTIQDKTVQVPGADGTYYYWSYFTQRPINISVAFDDLSEEQFHRIRTVFGDKKIHDLIFDETPYKVYRVKTTGTPNLKYVCFDKEPDELDRDYNREKIIKSKQDLYGIGARSPYGRVYKGEGQLNFVCYSPFARSRFKYIDQYTIDNIPEWGSMDTISANDVHYNLYDWVDSAGLKLSNAAVNGKVIDQVTSEGVMYYNPGDRPTDFILRMVLPSGTFGGKTFTDTVTGNYIKLDAFKLSGEDVGFQINTKLNLLEGVKLVEGTEDEYEVSGIIYNQYIEEGDFFKLPVVSDLSLLSFGDPAGTCYGTPIKGDVNFDGKVDMDDYQAWLYHLSGEQIFTDEQKEVFDLNQDGVADSTDALQLLRIINGKTSKTIISSASIEYNYLYF